MERPSVKWLTVVCGLWVSCSSNPPVATVTCTGPDQVSCGTVCAVLKTDSQHCGSCTTACSTSESCAAGACYPKSCANLTCDPSAVCVDNACVDSDCVGVVCPTGEACSLGTCRCAADRASCSGQCVDLDTDSLNCGGCARACPTGQACADGDCFESNCANQTCAANQVCYQGACADRDCIGVDCPQGEACSKGACGCFGASTLCGPDCRDTRTDSANCGACGHACAATESCAASVCYPRDCAGQTCDPLDVCSQGSCVDARCVGMTCATGQSCAAGTCVCAPGLTSCGGQCTNVATDPGNCGDCGHTCNGGTCGTTDAGACSCPSGRALCNGTCVDTRSDDSNCNGCGIACSDGGVCVASACACPAGQLSCSGSCIDVSSDNVNCGGCNVVCGTGKYCANGGCQLPFTCQSNYDPAAVAACPFFPLLNSNCGAETQIGSQHLVGFIDGGSAVVTPFTAAPGDRFAWFGTFSSPYSSAFWEADVRTSVGSYLTTATGFVSSGPPNLSIGAGGSVWPCAQPVDLRLASTTAADFVTYDISMTSYSRDRWNTGAYGLDFLDAGFFGHDGGSFCGQLCGDIRKFCGDDRETMSLIIEPGKAADLQMRLWTASGAANVDVQLYDPNGAFICPLVSNALIGQTFTDYQARVVNNTNVAQRVYLSPWDWGQGANLMWQIAVATEP